MRNLKEIEFDEKIKKLYDEHKKASLEDFKEALVKYRKTNKRFLILVCSLITICVITSYILLFQYFILKDNNDWLNQKVDVRDEILQKEAEIRCNEINQTFKYQTVLYFTNTSLVYCSKNNLVIGEMQDG